MLKVGILTFQDGYNRGGCDFYPIIKWKKKFNKKGVSFTFSKNHENKKLLENDVIIIDYRYYRTLITHEKRYQGQGFILKLIEDLKSKKRKVVLFDTGDSAGSKQFDFIEYVDLMEKKQLLKDKSLYTINRGVASYMVFLEDYHISIEGRRKNKEFATKYTPCPSSQLHKLRLGWNIGMIDYRSFPFSKYYPVGTSRLFNIVYKKPKFYNEPNKKSIDSIFRGKINKENENYSYQRNYVIELFNKDRYTNYITGKVVPKKRYLAELRQSKTCVSPFGWGEVCYRDFESIISGCVLLKPNMNHLETYPNVYKEYETYIPLKWDMSDLPEKLSEAIENYHDYISMIKKSKEIFLDSILNFDKFFKRFRSILEG